MNAFTLINNPAQTERLLAYFYGSLLTLPPGYRLACIESIFINLRSLLKTRPQVLRRIEASILNDLGFSRRARGGGGGAATTSSLQEPLSKRQAIRVGNFGQDDLTDDEKQTLDKSLSAKVPADIARDQNLPENITWGQAIIRQKGPIAFGTTGALLVLLMLENVAPAGLAAMGSSFIANYAATSLRKLFSREVSGKEKAIVLAATTIAVLSSLSSCAAGMLSAQTQLNDNLMRSKTDAWSAIGGQSIVNIVVDSSSSAIKRAAETYVLWVGANPSALGGTVLKVLNMTAYVFKKLGVSSELFDAALLLSEKFAGYEKGVKTVETAIAKTGIQRGYVALTEYYENAGALILIQSAAALLSIQSGFLGRYVERGFTGVKNFFRRAANALPPNTKFSTAILGAAGKIFNVGSRMLKVYQSLEKRSWWGPQLKTFLEVTTITTSASLLRTALFSQDKKKISTFNKRVAKELKAYKTKAKSAEEHRQRLARCSRRVSKQMKAEKSKNK